MSAPSAEDRQLAVDILTQRFIEAGKDPAEAMEVAAAVIDHAIEQRDDDSGGQGVP